MPTHLAGAAKKDVEKTTTVRKAARATDTGSFSAEVPTRRRDEERKKAEKHRIVEADIC